MSGIWNRTLVYLGLREEREDAYDELPERFVPEDDPHAEHAPPRPSMVGAGRTAGSDATVEEPRLAAKDAPLAATGSRGNGARPDPERSASDERPSSEHDNVLSLHAGDVHVRAVAGTGSTRAAVVEIAEFDDVEAVGARYRTGQPVVLDASAASADTARRVVDFVAGLTYALRGELTKVGHRSFLVVPSGVTLSTDERRRLNDLGYRLPTGSDA